MKKNCLTYGEVVDLIYSIPRFTTKNPPEATKRFYEYLGRPGESRVLIHVAGTNGKGSVCAYLTSILRNAGFHVGTFTSPHLVTMCERMMLDGEKISEEAFVACYEELEARLKEYPDTGYRPTFFDTLFFMAMLWYENSAAEILVLETGLGGKLDATNVLENKAVTVITKMGMDHMAYLGDTLAEIAVQKAGIMREGVPGIILDQPAEALGALLTEAKRIGSVPIVIPSESVSIGAESKEGIDFCIGSRYYGTVTFRFPGRARYQGINAAEAIACIEELCRLPENVNGKRIAVTKEQLTAGLQSMRWEGRLEEVAPGIFLDGAHNPDGVGALLDSVCGMSGSKILVYGCVRDKDYHEMIRMIAKSQCFRKVYVTQVRDSRGADTDSIAEAFRAAGQQNVEVIEESDLAYARATEQKGPEELLFVAGSLYLVGEIKDRLGAQ